MLLTDTLQAFVLVIGTGLLLFVGLNEVGGWSALVEKTPEGYFDMWKSREHPDFPWTGIVFSAPILAIWYWCTDQYIVQRVLSARNEGEAQSGTIFAAYLKVLPLFLFVVPGVIALVLYEDVSPETSDTALPTLVLRALPVGLRGFLLAALLAALMSSLSSIFNSCSTLITYDMYQRLKPDASETTLIRVGRVATVVLVVLGLLWIPFMKYISDQLYIYLQSVQGYIAPPIAACFLLGLFWPRLNGPGAISSLLFGFVLGASRLALELANGVEKTGLPSGTIWEWIAEVNFLHFAAMLFLVSVAVLFGVSLLTSPPDPKRIEGLTYQTLKGSEGAAAEEEDLPEPGVSARRRRINLVLSVILVVAMVALWWTFS